MLLVAVSVVLSDQLTKAILVLKLGYGQQVEVLLGFFRFVHWGNTGAAWSLFYGNNTLLAIVALLSLIGLFFNRHYFDFHTLTGQWALGLMLGGIFGNLIDRLVMGHVIDFLYFYIYRRGAGEVGFPAFNLADTAICSGVALMALLAHQGQQTQGTIPSKQKRPTEPSTP